MKLFNLLKKHNQNKEFEGLSYNLLFVLIILMVIATLIILDISILEISKIIM